MALAKIQKIIGTAVHVAGDDIDTDRIIPARFMKCLTFDGLGEFLFYDARHDNEGKEKTHPLNDPLHQNASILISGSNFGCGSSREHAPQSIYRAGFRAIIAGNFAEIFFGNSTNLGMPCVSMPDSDRNKLIAIVEENPTAEVQLDLVNKVVSAGDYDFSLEMRKGALDSLIGGTWDPLDELLGSNSEIENISSNLNYV